MSTMRPSDRGTSTGSALERMTSARECTSEQRSHGGSEKPKIFRKVEKQQESWTKTSWKLNQNQLKGLVLLHFLLDVMCWATFGHLNIHFATRTERMTGMAGQFQSCTCPASVEVVWSTKTCPNNDFPKQIHQVFGVSKAKNAPTCAGLAWVKQKFLGTRIREFRRGKTSHLRKSQIDVWHFWLHQNCQASPPMISRIAELASERTRDHTQQTWRWNHWHPVVLIRLHSSRYPLLVIFNKFPWTLPVLKTLLVYTCHCTQAWTSSPVREAPEAKAFTQVFTLPPGVAPSFRLGSISQSLVT